MKRFNNYVFSILYFRCKINLIFYEHLFVKNVSRETFLNLCRKDEFLKLLYSNYDLIIKFAK